MLKIGSIALVVLLGISNLGWASEEEELQEGFIHHAEIYEDYNTSERLEFIEAILVIEKDILSNENIIKDIETNLCLKKHFCQAVSLLKSDKKCYFKIIDQEGLPVKGIRIQLEDNRHGLKTLISNDEGICQSSLEYPIALIHPYGSDCETSPELYRIAYDTGIKFKPLKFDENDNLVLDSCGTTEGNPFIIKVTRKKNPPNPNVWYSFPLIHESQYLFENWKNNKTQIVLKGGNQRTGKDGQIYCKYWEKKCPIDLSVEFGGWDNGLKDIGEDRRVLARDVKVTVTLKGGGFVRRTKRLDTTAPESGYQETLVFNFKKGTRHKEARRSYFVKYPNGMFGVLYFDIDDEGCYFDGEHGTVVGDRNLETESSSAGPSEIGYFEDDDQYPQFLDSDEADRDNDPRYYTPVE